jgi:hypothetical protein
MPFRSFVGADLTTVHDNVNPKGFLQWRELYADRPDEPLQ